MFFKIIRKILVVTIIVLPFITDLGCKKQARCGCGKDVIFTLENEEGTVYFNAEFTNIQFTPTSNPYATYYFCNPGECKEQLSENKSGDILLVSGRVFWNCNYIYTQSNYGYSYGYGYQSLYRIYDIEVTKVTTNLYGK